jgi:hypothetical protein
VHGLFNGNEAKDQTMTPARIAIDLDRFDHMMALLNAPRTRAAIAAGRCWDSHEVADAIEAMCVFTECDDLERVVENIRMEIPAVIGGCDE